jgi:hypothetical protein
MDGALVDSQTNPNGRKETVDGSRAARLNICYCKKFKPLFFLAIVEGNQV